MSNMTLSQELQWRGFVNQTTLDDLAKLDENKLKFYMGFDASADSQTVGNLAGMMFAKCFLRHGYTGTLLAGGATSLIGDPGGKDKERPLQDEQTVAHNAQAATEQIQKVLHGHQFTMVNNLDWTRDMRVIPFLRDIGKHFSMTPLIQRDYIANRLGEDGAGISYTELSYTILQGMDYLHLYDTAGITLQLGGSDQWGNCLSGVELIRRARGKEVDVITLNLVINKATGKKFGKSEEGAIWLDPAKTSVYQFYQFWLNIDDAGTEGYLKIFTELDKTTVDDIMTKFQADPAGRLAQKTLAYEVTKLAHGQERADSVRRLSQTLFGGADYAQLAPADFELMVGELPTQSVKVGDDFITILVATGLASSNTEARRFLDQGAIYLNGQALTNQPTLQAKHSLGGYAILRRGKNTSALLKIS